MTDDRFDPISENGLPDEPAGSELPNDAPDSRSDDSRVADKPSRPDAEDPLQPTEPNPVTGAPSAANDLARWHDDDQPGR
ncbi:MAG: hypothetical protein VB036_00920 [Propionicimonas sp.]|nr:hypothetical protein [Propionicimonas sp.]